MNSPGTSGLGVANEMALNSWFPITINALPTSDHGSDDLKCLDLLTATVDEVTDEDGLTILT